jgi:phosphoserine phosphatase RsbU/P
MINEYIQSLMNLDSPVKTNFNRVIVLTFSLIICITRIFGDLTLYLFSNYDSPIIYFWKIATTILIFSSAFIYLFSRPHKNLLIHDDHSSNEFFEDLNKVLFISLWIIAGNVILPDIFLKKGIPVNLLVLTLSDIISILSLLFTIYVMQFIYKWLSIRRHKKTKKYLKVLVFGLAYYFLVKLISDFFDIRYNEFVKVFLEIFVVGLGIITFIVTKKNLWIAVLPRSRKLRLLFFSLIGLILSAYNVSISIAKNHPLSSSLDLLLPGISIVVGITFIYLMVFLLRLFFVSIASLPTSEIVERRTSEISSLTYLNKIVANTIDFNTLLDTVAQLALNVSHAAATWIELYESDGKVSIWSTQYIDEQQIKKLHENKILQKKFNTLNSPLLIESTPDNKELSFINAEIKIANSLIAVPLFSGDNRIGTLVAIHSEEYGFDNDDAKVISAFSDNLSIALENARLLKESLEKEHFKQELILAKEIQQKLLPQKLPQIENFTISAFSIPAEEVGGDFYDLGRLKNGDFGILIGDVSGKGMNAAFYMAQLKGVVLAIANEATGAADLLKKINSTLYGFMEKQMYITLTCMVLDKDNRKVTLARAGHMPAIFKLNNEIISLTPKGLGVGLTDSNFFDKNIEETEIEFNSGDIGLLFTDGLNELLNDSHKEFGIDSIIELIKNDNFDCAEKITAKLEMELKGFAGAIPQHDDMTAIAIVKN